MSQVVDMDKMQDKELRWRQDVARKVDSICYDHGLSQYQFADKIGISRNQVGNILGAKNMPNFIVILRICEAFGLPLDYFMPDDLASELDYNITKMDNVIVKMYRSKT